MKSKYGNRKTVVDGITFDSKREAARYQQLKMMEKAGEITRLRLQPRFELVPKNKTFRAVHYIADFDYFFVKDDRYVVEDAKGFRADIYKIKQKLMYHVHGINIEEV